MLITKKDIIDSIIHKIHIVDGDEKGYPTCVVYFTIDKGLTFNLPWPGSVWKTVEIPQNAVELADVEWIETYKPANKWKFWKGFEKASPEKNDTILQIKAKKISAIICPRMDEELGFYEPDSSRILFNDNSNVYCISCAPQGIPIGLFYKPILQNIDDWIDFFTVPTDINDF
jgi:hypothetical protein